MKCKEKCAANVSEITPQPSVIPALVRENSREIWGKCTDGASHPLDRVADSGVVVFTEIVWLPLGDRDALTGRQQALKSTIPSRRGHAEFLTREGQRSEVPRGRVLRPTRHRPGQVRDVAPRPRGECIGDACRRRVRLLSADVLPSQCELRRGRDRGVGSQEARASRAPQDPWRGAGVPRAAAHSRPAGPSTRVGNTGSTGVRSRCASQDNRKGAGWKKNSEVRSDAAEKSVAVSREPAPVESQYETLRMAALGEPMPPECRNGLVLFLRRGMWGWARSPAIAHKPEQPTRSSLSSSSTPDQRRGVIRVFASMALVSNNGRIR